MRHREEMEKREADAQEELATGGLLVRLRHAVAGLPLFRDRS